MRCRPLSCARLAPLLLALCFPAVTHAAPDPVGDPYLVADIEPSDDRWTLTDPLFGDSIVLTGSHPTQLTAWNGALFFAAHDFEGGVELWRSDGTADGTRRVADVCQGDCWGRPVILGAVGGGLVFWADDGVHGMEPWATDGTAAGTRLLADLCPGSCDGLTRSWPEYVWFDPHAIAPGLLWRGELYFETTVGGRLALWKTDGTPEGTAEVLDLCDESGCAREIADMVEIGSSLLVSAKGVPRDSSPSALYRVDAGSSSGELVTRTCEGAGPYEPRLFTPVRDRLVFTSACLEAAPATELQAPHLYATDGTPAGTSLLIESSDDTRTWPRTLTRLADRVYFLRGSISFEGSDRRLWRTDGTPGGTRRHPIERLPSTMNRMAAYDGELLMGGFADDQVAVWTTENGVSSVRKLLGHASFPTPIAGHLFFTRNGLELADELWVAEADGTDPRQVTDLNPRTSGSSPRDLVPLGDRVFFTARDTAHGRELWALPLAGADGTPPSDETLEPPAGPWLSGASLPGFRVKARFSAAGNAIAGSLEGDCIPETLCLSGALPGRTELLVRVVGPKLNGRLWPTLVRFSTSTVEVWIEQESTGEIEHYLLEGATPGSGDLTGLFDREGFEP